jgi:hypothetical protein
VYQSFPLLTQPINQRLHSTLMVGICSIDDHVSH